MKNKDRKENLLMDYAAIESAEPNNFPYDDFRGKKKGVNDERTGQQLRGAHCSGFMDGFKLAMKLKSWKKFEKLANKTFKKHAIGVFVKTK